MTTLTAIKEELQKSADPAKAAHQQKFFKTFSGGYGEKDHFLGVTVPVQRTIARRYFKTITIDQLELLFNSKYHEHRLTAIFILIHKFESAKTKQKRQELVNFYLGNLPAVNNWDLVDSSAYKILGPHLNEKDRSIIYRLAESDQLFEQRVAIITTFYFIRNNDFADTLKIADILLNHDHDLIHKAVGWMLREVGKRSFETEFEFLVKRYKKMPRTMLRYAIEKFEPKLRQQFLKGEI